MMAIKIATLMVLLMLLVGCEKRDLCTTCHDTKPRVVESGFPTLEPESQP